jgi:hypothetical protein
MVGAVVEIAGVAHRVGPLPAQADRPLPGGAWLVRPGLAAAKKGETREAEGHGARADGVSLSETGRWLAGRAGRRASAPVSRLPSGSTPVVSIAFLSVNPGDCYGLETGMPRFLRNCTVPVRCIEPSVDVAFPCFFEVGTTA